LTLTNAAAPRNACAQESHFYCAAESTAARDAPFFAARRATRAAAPALQCRTESPTPRERRGVNLKREESRMRRTHLTLLLALSLLLTQTRPALAQGLSGNENVASAATVAAVKSAPTKQQKAAAKRIEKLKRVVDKVGVGHRITVFLKNGEDLHGTVSRIGAEDFDVAEVDLKQLITVRYEFVEKVREGYGNVNLFTGKRRSPRKGTEIGIFAGLMFVVIALPLIAISGMKE
jgi:hypothetical protein